MLGTLGYTQQINVWRFGQGAGLDFNSGSPVALAAGPISSFECAASICDNQGQLLFYTDGVTVWNRNDLVMSNGSGLSGGNSATQSLIVQKPNDCSKYYIFHSGDHLTGNIGGYYTVVDMCLNGGLGDVVVGSKNIQIVANCSEKWTAMKHSNGNDIWILCHEFGNANYRKVLLTPTGVGASTVQSIGSVHASNCGVGYMKGSHNSQKLVTTNTFNCTQIDMFDFNTTTGLLSSYMDLTNMIGFNYYYGIEFSPNDQLLYLTDCYVTSGVYQMNLATNSMTTLATNGANYYYGGMQLGPDGKIYIARNGQNSLSVINSPNTVGTGCGFVNVGVTLAGGTTSQFGLINFVPWYSTTPSPQFVTLGNDTTLSCASSLTLAPLANCNATYLWSNASTSPTLTVTSPGTYWVEINNACGSDRDTVLISGASGNTTAAFSTSGAVLCGLPVTFVNASTGATSYLWNFGDNTTSTATNPTHIYGSTGTYQVMLIGSGPCGTDTTYSILVVDPSTVTAQFTASGNLCGSPIAFTNGSINATSYLWDFGDNTTSSSSSPIHTYTTSGTFQIMLIASNLCSIDTTYGIITIAPGNVIAGFASVSTVCDGNPIFFSNSSSGATSYSWDFGDSNTSSASSPLHTYANPGTYTVTLIATGTCASDTSVHTVVVAPVPVTAIVGLDTICAGQTTTLSASGGGSYQWSGGSSATTPVISISPSVTTTYYVQVSLSSCISIPDTHVVVVLAPPAATISGPTTICVGQTATLIANGGTSYQWSGGSNATTGSINIAPTSTTPYYVTPFYGTCAGTPDTHIVNVLPVPIVNASGNTSICAGQSTTLTATGGSTYQWSGGSNATTPVIVVSPPSTTTYFVTTSNGFCSSGFDTITVIVLPSPTVTIVGAQNVCAGDTVTLTAVGTATTYVWSGAASGTGTTISDIPTGFSNYYLVGYNAQGCSDTDMVSINVYDTPSVAILGNDTICVGESTALVCTGNGTFNWSPSTGLNSTSTQNVIATPTASITYTVITTDVNGCAGTDTFDVFVDACVGIVNQNNGNSILSIAPNPASSTVEIKFGQNTTLTIELVDVLGQTILFLPEVACNAEGISLNLSNYAAGSYILKVTSERESASKKLIISKWPY